MRVIKPLKNKKSHLAIEVAFLLKINYFLGAESASNAPLISWYEAENTNL